MPKLLSPKKKQKPISKKKTAKKTNKTKKPLKPKVLGTGMAAKAGKHLTERQKKLRAAMRKAGIK